MSDIKCPMCGKANPAEAEVCKYCQARLKPLVAPDLKSGGAPASNAGGDEADWLRSLAAKDPPPAAPATGPLPNPEDDDPDWLSRIRQKTQQEEGAVSPIGRPPKVEPGAADASTKPTGPLRTVAFHSSQLAQPSRSDQRRVFRRAGT